MKILLTVIAALCCLIAPQYAQAQTFTINNILDFGEVLDTGGNGGGADRITVNANGTFSHDPVFVVITPPTPADISFTGGPASTNYTVSVTGPVDINGTMGGRWRLNNYTFFPPGTKTTDPAGNGQFFVGARANTRRVADGAYADQTHTGAIEINVTFIP